MLHTNLKGVGEFVFKRKLMKDLKICKVMGGIKEDREILVFLPR